MQLSNSVFLDYTEYNQDQYSAAVAQYQDSYIVSGFTMSGNTLTPGKLFYKGWHLEFTDNYTATATEGDIIWVDIVSTLGSKQVDVLNTTYTQGMLTATVGQSAVPPSNAMPLYKYSGGTWVLQANGRIDSINNTKAKLDHNLVLDGSNIEVNNPLSGVGTINEVLQELQNEIADLTGGGLTEDTARNLFRTTIVLNNWYVDADFAGKNMAEIAAMLNADFASFIYSIDFVAEATDTILPSLQNAIVELAGDIYPTVPVSTASKMVFSRPRRTGLAGGDTLEVGFNNGPMMYFQYDNYGSNSLTVNTDAFQARQMFNGALDLEGPLTSSGNITARMIYPINVEATGHVNATTGMTVSDGRVSAEGFTANSSSGNAFIHNTNSQSAVSTLIPLVSRYDNTSFRLALAEGQDTSAYYTGVFHYDRGTTTSTGEVRRSLRFYDAFSNGVLHSNNNGSRKLAYETTRIAGEIETLNSVKHQAELNLASAEEHEEVIALYTNAPYSRVSTAHKRIIEQKTVLAEVETKISLLRAQLEIEENLDVEEIESLELGKETRDE